MRKYLPTISELIDRLSIVQLKEVFITEHKEEYAQEIKDIVHDLNKLGLEKEYDYSNLGELIRAVVVLSQMNLHIWHNETKYRAGEGDGNLVAGNQFCELPIENNYSDDYKDFVGHPSISSSKIIGDLIYEKISSDNK